jgi:hypothetical protein
MDNGRTSKTPLKTTPNSCFELDLFQIVNVEYLISSLLVLLIIVVI